MIQWLHKTHGITREDAMANNNEAFREAAREGSFSPRK